MDEFIIGIFVSFLVVSACSLGYSLMHAEKSLIKKWHDEEIILSCFALVLQGKMGPGGQ